MKFKLKNFIQLKYAVGCKEEGDWIKVKWSQNREITYPKKIEFDRDIAWLHGYWTGDRVSKTRKTVFGICDREMSGLLAVKDILREVSPVSDIGLIIYTKSPTKLKREKISKSFNLDIEKVEFKQDKKQKDDYFIIHCGYKYSLNKVFSFIEDNLASILSKTNKSIRYAWYAGLFDADGPFTRMGLGWNSTRETLKINLEQLLIKDGFRPKLDKNGIFLTQEDYNKFSSFILPFAKNKNYAEKSIKIIEGTYIPKTYVDTYFKNLFDIFGNREFSYKDVMKAFNWSRGQANMLLKGLVLNNYLTRDTNSIPYTYKISRPA